MSCKKNRFAVLSQTLTLVNVNIGTSNHTGRSIGDRVDDILLKRCKMKDIPNINVVKRKINVTVHPKQKDRGY